MRNESVTIYSSSPPPPPKKKANPRAVTQWRDRALVAQGKQQRKKLTVLTVVGGLSGLCSSGRDSFYTRTVHRLGLFLFEEKGATPARRKIETKKHRLCCYQNGKKKKKKKTLRTVREYSCISTDTTVLSISVQFYCKIKKKKKGTYHRKSLRTSAARR